MNMYGGYIVYALLVQFVSQLPLNSDRAWKVLASEKSDPWQYRHRYGEKDGRLLAAPGASLQELRKLAESLISVDDIDLDQLVFATANDASHYEESLDALGSVQKHFPHHQILYYDLGLFEEQVKSLARHCNVHYRTWDRTKYPHHIKYLSTYSFKVVLLMEALQTSPGVFWFDSSIRFTSSNLSTLRHQAVATDGLILFDDTQHSTFAVTHPTMYEYLSTDPERLKGTLQLGAGAMLVFKTVRNYYDVLHWYALCALVEQCIAPSRHRSCRFQSGERWKKFDGCHRFDQAAVNILLANKFQFNSSVYHHKSQFLVVQRYVTRTYSVKECRK